MRVARPVLAPALAAALLLGGCATLADGGPVEAADVAATVAGTEVTRAEIEADVEQQASLLEDVPTEELEDARLQLERDTLSARVQVLAVEAAASERFGITVDEARVTELVAENIEAAGGDEAFDALAAEQGLDGATAREFARDGAYVQALVEAINEALLAEAGIDEARLRAEYDATIESYQSSDARHILVETEAEAQDVLAQLEAGADFGELAAELSIDPGSGANGGSLGVAPRGSYVEPFSEAIYSPDTVIGEVIGPVESDFGFHIIIVDEIITAPFEEVRVSIEQGLGQEAFTSFLNAAFDEIDVTVDPYYGVWDVAGRQVVAAPSESPSESGSEAGEPTDAATEGEG